MRLPAIPVNRIDGDSSTSTIDRRASYWAERLRSNRGQCAAPGMMAFSWDNAWQPLHTPSEKVSGRWKKDAKASASAALYSTDFAQPVPAPSTSP